MLAWFLCRKRYNVRLLPHVTDLVYVELHNRNNCSVVKAKIFLLMMKLKRILTFSSLNDELTTFSSSTFTLFTKLSLFFYSVLMKSYRYFIFLIHTLILIIAYLRLTNFYYVLITWCFVWSWVSCLCYYFLVKIITILSLKTGY